MMQFINDRAASVFVKILFVLLILSFGVWGVADMVLDRGGSSSVAKVGDIEISQYDFRQRLSKSFQGFRSLEEMFGKQMAFPRQALTDNVLQAMIDEAALKLFVKDLNLQVHQDVIKDELKKLSIFQGENGKFSLEKYKKYVERSPYIEKQVISSLTAELLERQVQSIFDVVITPPMKVVELLSQKSLEKRSVQYAHIVHKAKDIKTPNDDVLEAFYHNNSFDFLSPEKRIMTYITISKEKMAKDFSLSDSEMKEIYLARDDLFGTPEKRELTQFVAKNKAQGLKLYEYLSSGKSIADAENEFGIRSSNLGFMEAGKLNDDVAQAVFLLEKGEVTLPIKTPFGFHVLKVGKIKKKVKKPFAKVKKELRSILEKELLIESVIELTNTVDEAINLGDDLETVATQYGLDIKQAVTIKKDQKKLPQGLNDKLVETIFLSEEGELVPLTEMKNGDYVAVRLDQVITPQPYPFNTVKKKVLKRWKEQEAMEKSRVLASSLLSRLRKDSLDFVEAAKKESLKVHKTRPFFVDSKQKNFTEEQVRVIFSLTSESPYVLLDDAETGKGYFLVKLDKVIARDKPAVQAQTDKMTAALSKEFKEQARQSLLAELRNTYGVKVYPKMVDQIAETMN